MTVTVVCDVLGEENNGTSIAAMNLIRTMRDKGHTVRVVCPDQSRAGQPGFFVVPTYNLGPLNNYVAKNGVCLAKPVRKTLEQALDGADVVHVLIPFALGHAAAMLARERGIALTAGFHCQAENFTNHIFLMNAELINRMTYRFFTAGCTGIVTVSIIPVSLSVTCLRVRRGRPPIMLSPMV